MGVLRDMENSRCVAPVPSRREGRGSRTSVKKVIAP
jgi:hypothetical protein